MPRVRFIEGWRDREGEAKPSTASGAVGGPCGPFRVRFRDALAYFRFQNASGEPESDLCGLLDNIGEDDREWFVDGLAEFAEEWGARGDLRGECGARSAASWFIIEADQEMRARDLRHAAAINEYEREEYARVSRREASIQLVGAAIGGLLVFLIIPLLIQIERNTRAAT